MALSEIATIRKGKKPSSMVAESVDAKPYLTADVLRGGDCIQFVPNAEASNCVELKGTEVVVLWDGAGAGDVFPSEEGILASTMATVEVIKPDLLLPRFLQLAVAGQTHILKSTCRGTTVPHVAPEVLQQLEIPVPPRRVQERIVDLVASVDAYIAGLEKQVEVARTARNAVLNERLTSVADSPSMMLKDLTSKIGSGATPRGGESVYQESGVNLIRSQNVHDGRFVHEGLVAIDDKAARFLDGVSVQPRDVLINITGASVARVCIVDEHVLPARVNQHVAILRVDAARLLPEFLLLSLLSSEIKSFLLGVSSAGTTRQAITKAQLEALEIVVPSMTEQQRIVEIVQSMESAVMATERVLGRAKQLRAGLLSDLQSGEHQIPVSYDKFLGAA